MKYCPSVELGFLRDLKQQCKLDKDIYDTTYPSGSQLARIYGWETGWEAGRSSAPNC